MLDTSTLSRDSFNLKKSKSDELPSYKVLIIGDQGIGKTSLIHRYIDDEFKENNVFTIGLDYQEKTVQVSPEDKILLKIWDTAGSEKFHSIAQSFFTNCDGIILCFDTTDSKTFENLNGWIDYINEYIEIKDNCDENSNNKKNENTNNEEEEEENEEKESKDWIDDEQFKPIIALTGTKTDLINNKNVSIDDVKQYTNYLKCEYFETSAKDGYGVDDLFFFMAKELFEKKIVVDQNNRGFKLGFDKHKDDGQSNSKVKCC